MELKKNNEIKYFSMFTGVGGFELGLEHTNKICEEGHISEQQDIQSGWNLSSSNCEGIKRYQNSGLFEDSGINSPIQGEWNETAQIIESLQGNRNNSSTSIFKCIGVSEIDKYSSELLKQKFPTIKNYGDATKINPSELPDFDMLCGGFPCQAFSIAGKRRGFKDTRGTLFFDIARIVKVKKPKIVLLENVKGLLNHNKGETFSIIIQTLSELGYDVQWMVLNSKFFGVPQNRERVFIIGSLRGEPRPEILPFRESNQEINKELEKKPMIIGTTKSDTAKGTNSRSWVHNINGIIGAVNSTEYKQPKQIMVQPVQLVNINRAKKPYNSNEREMKFKIRNDEISYTIKSASHECMVKENMKIRRLTPTECERLQGFPDGWTEGFSDTQRYKMMGNAVTVNVIKAIGGRLKKSI